MTDDEARTDTADGPTADAPYVWTTPPSVRTRSDVKRAVDRLLDALAPERVISRAPHIPGPVERHRTPRGCILQATAAAVSVTWFPEAVTDMALGELRVTAWRGVVSRPGSAHRAREGASVACESTWVPVDAGPAGWAWRGADGAVLEADDLVAYCAALLEEQVAAAGS
jgi:hypothetical protein